MVLFHISQNKSMVIVSHFEPYRNPYSSRTLGHGCLKENTMQLGPVQLLPTLPAERSRILRQVLFGHPAAQKSAI